VKRNILHLRIDGFPVAVERLRDASLAGRPVAVCPRHSPRSLIFSASPEARQEGVFEGMPLTRALKRCRRLVILPPDEGRYRKAGEAVTRVLQDFSPLVEPGRWGRFFVDMTGTRRLFGPVQDTAFRMRREVAVRLCLAGTLGIGSNKLVSGVAARVIETHGDLVTVPPGSEAAFLAPLNVRMLPALRNRAEREKLTELNIRRVHQLAVLTPGQLAAVFGRRAALLRRQALGMDDQPVRIPAARPFILEEAGMDTNDDERLLGTLFLLMERACRRLRVQGVVSRTVWLHIRYADGLDMIRKERLPAAGLPERVLFPILESLFLKVSGRRQRLRHMSLTFTDLSALPAQTALFDFSPHSREEALIRALDDLRGRFGEGALQWGRERAGGLPYLPVFPPAAG